MKKLIAGLICFVVLLALSNLGTSLAAAFLAKDMVADNGSTSEGEVPPVPAMRISETGDVAAAQTIADTFEATELDDEDFEERRRLVLQEMEDDPHSHPHRRDLAGCNKKKSCSGRVTFDNSYMKEEEFILIENKCKKQQNVYLKVRHGDDSRNECVCNQGASVVVKEKKTGRSGGGNKNKKDKNKTAVKLPRGKKKTKQKGKPREVIIERGDGRTLHADCEDGWCHCGGRVLQGQLGDICKPQDPSSCDSEQGLVCDRTDIKSETKDGKLRQKIDKTKYGYCVRPTKKSEVIVKVKPQGRSRGDFCDVDVRNTCGTEYWCEPDDFDDIVRDVRRSGGSGGAGGGGYAGAYQGVVIAGPSGVIDTTNGAWNNGAAAAVPRNARQRSTSGVGTCQPRAGSGQTCYDDWQCDSNECDGLGDTVGGGAAAGQGGVISGPSGTILYGGYGAASSRSTVGVCY